MCEKIPKHPCGMEEVTNGIPEQDNHQNHAALIASTSTDDLYWNPHKETSRLCTPQLFYAIHQASATEFEI
jgi:hypothetical protein